MYVRWKRQIYKPHPSYYAWKRDERERVTWRAFLVECKRIDGKPRQHIVSYLGCMDERWIGDMWEHIRFWQGIGRRVKPLALTDDQRKAMERGVSSRVRAPSQAEYDEMVAQRRAADIAWERERAEIEARIRAKL